MKRITIIVTLAVLFGGMGCVGFPRTPRPRNLNIVFIGDSITSGYLMKFPERDAPPVYAAAWLKGQLGVTNVLFRNCGKPAYRTDQFLPDQVNSAWGGVKQAGESYRNVPGTLIFSVMLGANDSAGNGDTERHSPARFKADMKRLVEALRGSFPESVVVIHHPTGYTKAPGTNPEYLARYKQAINSLVGEVAGAHSGRVFLGDVSAWAFFDANMETHWFKETRCGVPYYVHPNELGAGVIGGLWGKAILQAVNQSSPNPAKPVSNARD